MAFIDRAESCAVADWWEISLWVNTGRIAAGWFDCVGDCGGNIEMSGNGWEWVSVLVFCIGRNVAGKLVISGNFAKSWILVAIHHSILPLIPAMDRLSLFACIGLSYPFTLYL